jgi:hypothetical protein
MLYGSTLYESTKVLPKYESSTPLVVLYVIYVYSFEVYSVQLCTLNALCAPSKIHVHVVHV